MCRANSYKADYRHNIKIITIEFNSVIYNNNNMVGVFIKTLIYDDTVAYLLITFPFSLKPKIY
jgi:hypothetical protein